MLDKILEQSESYRKKMAMVLTFVIGIAIFTAWLMIAGYNVRKSSQLRENKNTEALTVQKFRQNLPSLRQKESVITDLAKQNSVAKAQEMIPEKDKKSLIDRLFGN